MVLDKLAENGGSIGDAIRATGLYSETVALTPTKITSSKTWEELMDTFISDDDLAKKHKKLLNAVTVRRFDFSKEDSFEDIEATIAQLEDHVLLYCQDTEYGNRYAYVQIPDANTQEKALDKAYKLRKRYGEMENPNVAAKNTYNFIFAPEVREKVRAIDESIKSLLVNGHVEATETPLALGEERAESTRTVGEPNS